MNMAMKILLILPSFRYMNEKYYEAPPLGLGYLAAVLQRRGAQVKIIDVQIERISQKELSERVREYAPNLIGVSIVTEARHSAAQSIKQFRKILPDALIIAGGPHPSLTPQDTLEKIPELDLIVKGEGEETISDVFSFLIGEKNLDSILGISYRKDGKIIHNPARPPIEDLDKVPFPARDLFPLNKYFCEKDIPGKKRKRFATMISSRGCSMSCIFCATSMVWGKKITYRSIPNMIEEISFLMNNYGIGGISIEDDSFSITPSRVEKFCKELIDKKIDISWICCLRVDILTKDLLELMKQAGCFHIVFGAESGNDHILKNVLKKSITKQQIWNVSKWCEELGIYTEREFLISIPTETYEMAMDTIDFMQKLDKNFGGQSDLNVLRIYPGTEVERLAVQKGIIPKDFSWMDSRKAKTFTFPSTLGDAPIFLDKMTWAEISAIIFQWVRNTDYPIHRKVWAAVKDIRSLRDIVNLTVAGFNFLRYKINLFMKNKL